jgi:hypothetical protein
VLSQALSHRHRLASLVVLFAALLAIVATGSALATKTVKATRAQRHSRASDARIVCHPARRQGHSAALKCTVGEASRRKSSYRAKHSLPESKLAEPSHSGSGTPSTSGSLSSSSMSSEEGLPPVSSAPSTEGFTSSGEGSAPSGKGSPPSDEAPSSTSPVAPTLPSETWEGYSAWNPMPAAQRPGDSSSPFNQPVGPAPQVLPNSAAMVAFLLGDHTPGSPVPADQTRPDGGTRPLYYAALVELVATEPWGQNPLNGRKIRVPQDAVAEEESDGHLTIVLAPDDAKVAGETVDLWQAQPVKEGKLLFSWGGPGNMTGTLLQSEGLSADAAGFDLIAGQVRGPELKAGAIDHALVVSVKDVKPTYVYPASHTDGSSDEAAAPAMGQHFYLAYSDAEIAALPVLPWKKAILTALAHYGFYVGDSGNNTLGFIWEGLAKSSGAPEPFVEIGKEQGVSESGSGYDFKLSEGVDWARLRAIAPPSE